MRYLFDPQKLQEIVRLHQAHPLEHQIEAITETLERIYGPHITAQQPWMWSNAGGMMCAICPLHVSLNEYLLFCGTAVGSEGHSGRHRAEIHDIVMAGELWTYEPGAAIRTVHVPGDAACRPRGSVSGSRLRPGTWLLEYARGNVPSMLPFALANTLFSTLDTTELRAQLRVASKLMWKELGIWLGERRSGRRFEPSYQAIRHGSLLRERRLTSRGIMN